MGNGETGPVEGYKCIAQFKRQDGRAGGVAMYERNNATIMATHHILKKLDKPRMTKTSFKLAASESCGDICAAECLVNGRTVLVVTVYVSPNTLSNHWISLIL
jgi:hypothetical protein